ncbi:hypothetical protein [Sphingobacterium kitahiroshimense]|uniref:DUF4926 domain-containing protein n=1 Tax=Sphingobacterium kitahiroshimense TaxID=470446 RepID=A0ABV0BM89_9SPHI
MKDLVGIQVMVHPDLTQDPVNKQGHLGTITHIVDDDRAAYVRFKNQAFGLYSTDALLMLIPPELIADKLRSDVIEMNMDVTDVVDILEMYQIHAAGTPEAQQEALDWAMTHDKISKAIIFSVEDWIEFQIDRLDQQQTSGRGR